MLAGLKVKHLIEQRGLLIAPTTIVPTIIAPTVISPTVISPTIIAPTLIAPTIIAPTTIVRTIIAPTPKMTSVIFNRPTCRSMRLKIIIFRKKDLGPKVTPLGYINGSVCIVYRTRFSIIDLNKVRVYKFSFKTT